MKCLCKPAGGAYGEQANWYLLEAGLFWEHPSRFPELWFLTPIGRKLKTEYGMVCEPNTN